MQDLKSEVVSKITSFGIQCGARPIMTYSSKAKNLVLQDVLKNMKDT